MKVYVVSLVLSSLKRNITFNENGEVRK